jgi:hypothetical protein
MASRGRLLHLIAAGWAVGLAISSCWAASCANTAWAGKHLAGPARGIFSALLFAPVVALPALRRLQRCDLDAWPSAPAPASAWGARRWVCVALLLLVVVPRLLLAGWSAWQRRRLGRAVRIIA